ncbi:MAG: hypothetical protein R6V05_00500 [Candidatus Brocadiia bacterium]
MPEPVVRPKVVLVVTVVFLALVVVHIWIGSQDNGGGRTTGPRLSRLEIADQEEPLDIERTQRAGELEELIGSRAYLLTNGETNERRATAIQLAYLTTNPQESDRFMGLPDRLRGELRDALTRGLNDEDEIVSQNCLEALLGLWRTSDSIAATEQFREGLAAYRAGQIDRAMAAFQSAEDLRGSVPPDLYRMKAQVYLQRQEPDKALAACAKALEAEPRNFLALLIVTHVHLQQGNHQKARRALDTAETIYQRLPQAEELRAQISRAPGG